MPGNLHQFQEHNKQKDVPTCATSGHATRASLSPMPAFPKKLLESMAARSCKQIELPLEQYGAHVDIRCTLATFLSSCAAGLPDGK